MSKKNWKAVTIDWQALLTYDEVEIIHVCLTQKQIAILKACLVPAYWSTRWENLTIGNDALQGIVSEIDYKLDGNECDTMDCDDVADCIENSEAVQDALLDYIVIHNGTGGVGNPDDVLPEEIREDNLLPDDFTCDNDHRYGSAVGIVEAIHSATLEVFEKIEVLTNPLELAAEIADNVPVVEAAGVAAEIILWIQESAYDQYVSAWSDTVKDKISCEIFCLMQDEYPCHLDYEMLMEVYQDVAFPSPPSITASWVVWAEWLIALPFTSNVLIVKLCGLLGLLTMRYGGKFGSMILGIRSLQTTISLLADDTNPDWETLCTECPEEWTHFWDFENVGMEAWTIESDYGIYTVGVGVVAQPQYLEGDWKMNIIRDLKLDEPIPRCWRFTIHCEIVRGSFEGAGAFGVGLIADPVGYKGWNSGHITTGTKDFVYPFDLANLTFVNVLHALSDHTESAITGSMIITGVTLAGQGTDPFEGRETS